MTGTRQDIWLCKATMNYFNNQSIWIVNNCLAFQGLPYIHVAIYHKPDILPVLPLNLTKYLINRVNRFIIKIKRKKIFGHRRINYNHSPDFMSSTEIYFRV